MEIQQQQTGVPVYSTVKQFSQRYPAFSEPAIRHIKFASDIRKSSKGEIKGNGFAPAFVRLGRKVLIDEAKFFEILRAKQSRSV